MFKQDLSEFFGHKSNYIGVATVGATIYTFTTGTIDMAGFIQGISFGMGILGLRDAIAKIK